MRWISLFKNKKRLILSILISLVLTLVTVVYFAPEIYEMTVQTDHESRFAKSLRKLSNQARSPFH
jgi:hypothetical protein